jgi:hypothetical protein
MGTKIPIVPSTTDTTPPNTIKKRANLPVGFLLLLSAINRGVLLYKSFLMASVAKRLFGRVSAHTKKRFVGTIEFEGFAVGTRNGEVAFNFQWAFVD